MEKHTSEWRDSTSSKSFQKLNGDYETDILIVGGGIAGVTTAHLLSKSNQKVALVEKAEIGNGETGNTTAMITHFFDVYSEELANKLNRQTAIEQWTARQKAIDKIAEIIEKEKIDCDFKRCNSYAYAIDENGKEKIKSEVDFAKKLGYEIEFKNDDKLPFKNSGYAELKNQAKFHPLKYIFRLAEIANQNGVEIFTNTNVNSIVEEGEGFIAKTDNGNIKAKKIIMMTNIPISAGKIFQGKFTPYISFVIEVETQNSKLEEANYWDSNDPYFYLRKDKSDSSDKIIIGGCDIKVGESASEEKTYYKLKNYLENNLGIKDYKFTHKWSGEVIESFDKVPLIGEYEKNKYLATGFWGNGMTFGTVAAIVISELILNGMCEMKEWFNPKRMATAPSNYLKQGVSFAKEMIKGRLLKDADTDNPDEVAAGEGKIVKINGKQFAIYKDENGKVIKLSPICTHMGCIVNWNGTEKTWDCPCHGSRFSKDGEVINGPAKTPLEKYEE